MIEYRLLGRTGIRVSNICLGTAKFGVGPTEEMAPKVVQRALDLGINFFDCANTYGNRASFDRPGLPQASERRSAEEILGDALRGHRHEVFVSSKVQEPVGSGPNSGGPLGGGLSRVHIRQQIERSLRRLQTDYIDVYYAHHFDPTTPMEETLSAFNDLIREGKIRYYALSNFQAWQVVQALWEADRRNFDPAICLQMTYNVANRAVEANIVPVCHQFGLTMTVYSPLGMGLLTGPYTRALPHVGLLLNAGGSEGRRGFKEPDIQIAEGVEKLAAQWGHSPVEVSLAWLLARAAVTSAIVGPEDVAELEQSVKAADVMLDAGQMAALDTLVPNSSMP